MSKIWDICSSVVIRVSPSPKSQDTMFAPSILKPIPSPGQAIGGASISIHGGNGAFVSITKPLLIVVSSPHPLVILTEKV